MVHPGKYDEKLFSDCQIGKNNSDWICLIMVSSQNYSHLRDAGIGSLAELQAALLAVNLDDARSQAVVVANPVGQQPLCAYTGYVSLQRVERKQCGVAVRPGESRTENAC